MRYRYDIQPSREDHTRWTVVDTYNRNMPISDHDTREKALAEALRMDRR